jgi:capsular exopolysaccharide synthesis family protein
LSTKDLQQEFLGASKANEGLNIDFKRVMYQAIRYWYLIVLSLLIALSAAFLRNRYATRVYPVTASILIKEAEDASGGEMLYNNPLVSYHRNYLNELYIIRSYPLIESVLDDLNFGVSFYREGNFLTTEVYDYIPVDVSIINNKNDEQKSFTFTVTSDNTFELEPLNLPEDAVGKTQVFLFGDTVRYEKFELIFNISDRKSIQSYRGDTYIFTYTPVKYFTSAYVNKLNADWAEEGSGVVNLTINGPNPVKEKDFLEGLIKRYQEYDLEKKNQTASRAVAFITEQLEGISDSLRYVEQQLERFKNQNVVTDLSGEALRLYQKLEVPEAQKSELIIRSSYYNYLMDYIKTNENLDQIILPSSVGIGDPILSGLVNRMIDIQLELKLMKPTANPVMKGARHKISEIKKDIIESVKNQKITDKIKLDYINQQIKDIEKQLHYLPRAERKLVSIQRNYSLLENLYIFLLQKRSESAISQASNTSDIVVVNPPMQAGGAITPKTSQNYIIAGVLGLSVPFVLFVLLEMFNTRVQSREDIEKLTSIPFIGGVGHKRTSNNLEVLTHPKTSIAESFRALRSNLNYFLGKREQAVFLITSSISGEGKTFTSINLASVLAMSGKRTLIVGADMRRPRIFSDFSLSNETGLSTFLAGIAEFNEVVQKTAHKDLDLISGGPIPPNPSELLLTSRMEVFLAEAKKRYDYIILDTPPLAIVTDAFVLSGFADHTIFLVRQNYTPKDFLKTIEDFFATGKLKNISIVLNDIYRSGPGYGYGYGYNYGYGFGYGYDSKASGNDYYSDEVN